MADTEPEPLFDELTKAAARLLRAPYALISVMDETNSFWKSTHGLPEAMRSEVVADSFCQYVVERGEDLFAEDVRLNEFTRSNPTIETKGVRAWAGCPVEFNGEILGAFCVIDNQLREWTLEDRAVLSTLAGIASREITLRAELADAENVADEATTESARVRSVIDTLRTSLLPPVLPTIPGLGLDAWFAAADNNDMLLGDFYDVFPLGEGRWGLVVGDVCGHGVEAAKLTSLVRYSLRSAAIHHNDPVAVMAEVDAAIRADRLDQGRFATVCYLAIDTRKGISVRWARAGHPFPILASETGARNCEDANGPPLGIAAVLGSSPWSAGTLVLGPGQRLVVFTDGLTDVRSPQTGDRLGDDNLLALIGRLHAEDETADPTVASDSFMARLTRELETSFSTRPDDVAVVVLGGAVRS